MNKCKGCQWYGKPYWSIINPCDNCPRENTNIEIITRWQDPTIEELQKRIDKAIEYLKDNACYENTISELFCDDLNYDDCMELLKILRGEE